MQRATSSDDRPVLIKSIIVVIGKRLTGSCYQFSFMPAENKQHIDMGYTKECEWFP